MIYLFHGDDHYQSRQGLFNALKKYQNVDPLSDEEIKPELIINFTGKLFSSKNRALVLNRLFSLSPTRLKKIISLIRKLSQQNIDVFIWEEKKLKKEQISSLGNNTKVYLFKLPPHLFKFLDTIGDKRNLCLGFLSQLLKSHPPQLILYLAERRLRELLLAKMNPQLLKLTSWQKTKLATQAKNLKLEEIKEMYLKLVEIDWKNKTGQLGNSLENELILLIAQNEINQRSNQ